MRNIDENYDDLDDLGDFDRFMAKSQTPDSVGAEEQREQRFEDAFMDDIPPTPAPQRQRAMQSIEPVDDDMHQASAGASSSNSFQVRQQSVKSENEDGDLHDTEHQVTSDRDPSQQNEDASSVKSSRAASDAGNTPPPINLYNSTSLVHHNNLSVQRPRGPTPPVEELVQHQAALEIADSEDDDDLMIIDEDRASPEARHKWLQYQSATTNNDVIFVKEEPKDVPAAVTPPPKKPFALSNVLAQQRALLARKAAEPPRDAAGSSSGWREHDPQEEGSGTNRGHPSFRYHSPNIPDIYREGREDPMQVDAAMRPGDEDHSWMEQDDDIDEDYENMKADIAKLQKKSTTGNFSTMDKMQLFKLEKQFAVKERLRAAASRRSDRDEDDSLFVPESRVPEKRSEIIRRHRRNLPRFGAGDDVDVDEDDNFGGDSQVSDDDDAAFGRMLQEELGGLDRPESSTAGQNLGLTKAGKPRKRRAKNAREFVAQEEEQRREKERSKNMKKVCFTDLA